MVPPLFEAKELPLFDFEEVESESESWAMKSREGCPHDSLFEDEEEDELDFKDAPWVESCAAESAEDDESEDWTWKDWPLLNLKLEANEVAFEVLDELLLLMLLLAPPTLLEVPFPSVRVDRPWTDP